MGIPVSIVKGSYRARLFLLISLLSFTSSLRASSDPGEARADTARRVVINTITISGNHQTRPSIILRELAFHEKDTIRESSFHHLIRAGSENIFNTTLFNFVTIDTVPAGGDPERMDVKINVVERWYIWPWPYFEISDRNFNTWA
jgi:hypothetical protein